MAFEISNVAKAAASIKSLCDQFYYQDVTIRVCRFPPLIDVRFNDGDRGSIAHFTLSQQSGCCGALVSHNTYVYEPHRGQGVGQAILDLKEAIAKEFGYSTLVATVDLKNKAEVHILQKHGWSKGWEFKNDRTGNLIGFFFKTLVK